MVQLAGLSWVDWALAGVLVLSVAVGLWRGLVYELFSLVGWVVAFVVAQAWGGAVSGWLPLGAPGSVSRLLLAFAVTFIVTLIVWTLLARLARMLISATPLSAIDRVLGAGFGLARGLLVLLITALVVTLTPASRSAAWQSSYAAAWLGVVLSGLKPALPAAYGRHLDARGRAVPDTNTL